jgi:enoyl-CoA hydratase/carnithine racemase
VVAASAGPPKPLGDGAFPKKLTRPHFPHGSIRLAAPELLMFTRMTGDVVRAMRACPQPIVAAVYGGVCAGVGAILAMASDLRLATARSKTAFLINSVGLAGCGGPPELTSLHSGSLPQRAQAIGC